MDSPSTNKVAPSASAQVKPADCGCGGTAMANSPVYVMGALGFDFGTDARRDALTLANWGVPIVSNADLYNHLANTSVDATAVIWTLSIDSDVLYAVQPAGPFAKAAYLRLQSYLQQSPSPDRLSVPGWLAGTVTLHSGQVVPAVQPDLEGIVAWSSTAVSSVQPSDLLQSFLDCLYSELRNMGTSPKERAINYAATNFMRPGGVFSAAFAQGLVLEGITAEKSDHCRPGSQCWDVLMVFFNPGSVIQSARTVYRTTVDVSAVKPVMLDRVQCWNQP